MPSTVGFVPHKALHEITRARPAIAAALWRETLVDSAMFRDWIVNVSRRPAARRMPISSPRLPEGSTPSVVRRIHILLPLTQTDLADALGLTSIHVNRVLQVLRKDGVLELKDTSCASAMPRVSKPWATSTRCTCTRTRRAERRSRGSGVATRHWPF